MASNQRRYFVVIGALALLGACALPSVDEYAAGSATSLGDAGHPKDSGSGHPSDVKDATVTADRDPIVTPPNDAGDPGTDSSPPPPPITNLLPPESSDFETACSTSNNGGYLATLQPGKAVHSGALSCRVCRAPDQTNAAIWSIDNGFPTTPTPGQEYHATVWVRRPPGSTDAIQVALALRTHDQDYNQIEWQGSSAVTLSDDIWHQLTVAITLTQSAPAMDTYTWAENDPAFTTPCFLVDDYVVWRAK